MNRLFMRIWLLLAIAFVLNACSSTAPTVKRDKTMAYRTMTQPRTALPQNFYRSVIYFGTQPRTAPPQNFYRSVTNFGTQPRTDPPQNFYRSVTYFGTQPRTALPQNFYRSATHSGTQPRTAPPQYFDRSATHFGEFQIPSGLEPAVEFWRKTYVVWHRSEVAFHDDRYLDVIYEVMVLPGDVDESLTSEQKEMVNQRRDLWKAQLSVLESKLRYNVLLNANDRQMIAKLTSSDRQLNSVLNGASERVRSQRGIRERFIQGLEISRRYDRQFRKIFRDAGLPEDLAYLPHVESSFQPAAKSSAGAVGMWQFTKAAAQTFMPAVHRHIVHRPTGNRPTGHRLANNRVDQRLDPFASAIGAARYLSHAYNILGDWPTAITSYNHGINGMIRAQDQVGRDFARIVETYDGPAFGFASRNYYAQFLATCEIVNNPMQYFPYGERYESSREPSQYLTVE
jgi:membrane-bound lytic murein transglycosylase D